MATAEIEINDLAAEGYEPFQLQIAGGAIINTLIIIYRYDGNRKDDLGAALNP